jgi:aspartyl-tRNA(Asn)/glutamyl-tRNA(Gln) amidotransferase subunit B
MSTLAASAWQAVIGLEVHCQLATATKLFCGCRNAFGEPPNSLVCPVCTGQPGALPVFNAEALDLALRAALALGCDIATWAKFDRKHYFYCDLPKGFQISQYDQPFCRGGGIKLSTNRSVAAAGSSSPAASACASCASISRRTRARRSTTAGRRRWSISTARACR